MLLLELKPHVPHPLRSVKVSRSCCLISQAVAHISPPLNVVSCTIQVLVARHFSDEKLIIAREKLLTALSVATGQNE